jgi:1-acyl-sn-glycerol-3-phosphate acyltransferase
VPRARFVSKADVQRWPLVNRLVDAAGTLYIEREKRRDALRVVHQMAQALQSGDTVAVFPEGTTGEGHGCCPFTPTCCRPPSPPPPRCSQWRCAMPMPSTR